MMVEYQTIEEISISIFLRLKEHYGGQGRKNVKIKG